MMNPSWHQVRLDLYKSLRTQCERILGRSDAEIAKYQKDYQKDIDREWSESSVKELIKATHSSDVLLLGDFHALYQSQKGHLRILRILPRKRPKILFVEFIASKDQAILDAYMDGQLSDKQFLKDVRWKESWGFSWRSYKPILVWAKKRKVPVVAIDKSLKKHGDQSLHERDEFASTLISDHLFQYPGHLGIVIMGDYHISKKHLPKLLKAKLGNSRPIMRIFQNSENIYFSLATQGKEYEVDVIKFDTLDFGIVSVAPWVKWHSLLMHLESQIEGDSEIYHQVQDEVLRFYRVLKSDLEILDLDEDFEVISINDFLGLSRMERQLEEVELKQVECYIKAGISFYIPKIKTVIVSKISLNYAAEAAMSVWHSKVCQNLEFNFEKKEYFYHLVWSFVVTYFGSKLINPKRKADTIYDINLNLKNSKTESRILKQVVRLKSLEWLWLAGLEAKRPLNFSVLDSDRIKIAKKLGAMAGEKLYFLYRKKLLKNDQLIDYLSAPFDKWPDRYFSLIALMEKFPDPFISKRLKI
jgi:hypothetical protein